MPTESQASSIPNGQIVQETLFVQHENLPREDMPGPFKEEPGTNPDVALNSGQNTGEVAQIDNSPSISPATDNEATVSLYSPSPEVGRSQTNIIVQTASSSDVFPSISRHGGDGIAAEEESRNGLRAEGQGVESTVRPILSPSLWIETQRLQPGVGRERESKTTLMNALAGRGA